MRGVMARYIPVVEFTLYLRYILNLLCTRNKTHESALEEGQRFVFCGNHKNEFLISHFLFLVQPDGSDCVLMRFRKLLAVRS